MKPLTVLFFLLHVHMVYAQTAADSLTRFTDSVPNRKEPWKKALLHTGIAAGYVAATYFCFQKEDNHVQKESLEHRHPVKDWGAHAVSPLGTSQTNWMAWATTTGFAYISKNTRLQKTVFVWAGSLLLNDIVTNKLKNQFQRYRPNTGKPPNTFDWSEGPNVNRSFPSAHTSNAFTTATVFATMYKDKHWVAPVAYGLAVLVGYSRVYNNAHWVSDVMAGAAVGFLSAKAVIGADKYLAKKNIRLYPLVGPRGGGVSMTMTIE